MYTVTGIFNGMWGAAVADSAATDSGVAGATGFGVLATSMAHNGVNVAGPTSVIIYTSGLTASGWHS